MRAIDADAFKAYLDYRTKTGMGRTIAFTFKHMIDEQPTIEPRCETCEAFNKTRLLIPQPEHKKGKWINVRHDNIAECDQCGITGRAWMNFCFDCGADMTEGEG